MTVIDWDPDSSEYGRVVGWTELPTAGNELHHFGWNACSSALCHQGHGELKQYDVADPFHPRETGSVRLGGIVGRQPHPAAPELRLGGGPQMVEVSRDGRRVYLTNSLYGSWDHIFYPDGVGAWAARLDADLDGGGIEPDPRFFPNREAFRGLRVHQTRLQAGDASSDSYCHTS
jgi:methanethiol oxidase